MVSLNILYQHYLEALQVGSRVRALKISQLALAAGTDIRNLYMGVFQPAMYEIGRLWETNQLSVAQEHLATSITRTVMAQLYTLVSTRLTPLRMFMNALRRTVVTTSVSGNLHEIGIRMVADFFELEGWRVYHLGCNIPPEDVVSMVNQRPTNVLAVSVTLNSHIPQLHDLIRMVRASPAGARVTIMVGGQPINRVPELCRKVGADLTATNARDAVQLARSASAGSPGELCSESWVMEQGGIEL
jgi:methanogenic corrinoid protein MtbC1